MNHSVKFTKNANFFIIPYMKDLTTLQILLNFHININHSIIMIIGYKITMKVRLEMTLNNRYNRLIKKVKSINCAFLIEIRVITEFTT